MNSSNRLPFVGLFTNMQILVVDNNQNGRKIYAYLLEEYGAKVTVAASVEEALKTLDYFIPDIVIGEMSFLDEGIRILTQKLRDLEVKIDRQISVIFSTAAYVIDDAGVGTFTDNMHVQLLQSAGFGYFAARRLVNA
jgi:CheY-like chemotaxis protein